MKYRLRLSIIASALVMLAVSSLHAQNISGDWQGTLRGSAAGRELRLVLRISKSDSGWNGKFYSIDQQPINAVAVTSLESGKYDPRLPLAFKIARAFGQDIEEVFIWEQDSRSKHELKRLRKFVRKVG